MTGFQLFDALPAHIEDALRASIRRFGVLVPITVDQDGVVLDGHHRRRIADELAVPYDRLVRVCESDEERREIARTLNSDRRQLSEEQRRAVAVELRQQGHSYRAIAGALGVSEPTVRRDIQREEIASGDAISQPERVARQGGGSYPARRPQVIARDDREQQRAQAALTTLAESDVELAPATIGVSEATAVVKHRQREQDKRDRAAAEAATVPVRPTIRRASALDWLPGRADCDLLVTDPPYSTDVADVYEFAREWLPVALGKVKPTGRAYVCIGAYPHELRAYLDVPTGDFTLANVLVWTYRNTLGPSPTHDYKLNWQAVLYYRGPAASRLDCPEMVEQFTVQDINAPDGRLGDRWHAWQKPDELANRFVRHASKPGDLVLDPFAGTGTFLLAAARLGRVAAGCDISEANIAIARERGCLVEE